MQIWGCARPVQQVLSRESQARSSSRPLAASYKGTSLWVVGFLSRNSQSLKVKGQPQWPPRLWVKNPSTNAGDWGSIPDSGRSPGGWRLQSLGDLLSTPHWGNNLQEREVDFPLSALMGAQPWVQWRVADMGHWNFSESNALSRDYSCAQWGVALNKQIKSFIFISLNSTFFLLVKEALSPH